MPELPEVETLVRDLKAQLVGRTLVAARVRWAGTIAYPTARAFTRAIRGCTILDITRRAKFLIFHLSVPVSAGVELLHPEGVGVQLPRQQSQQGERYLLTHLRMTGGFSIDPPAARRDKHQHVLFTLDSGLELRFRDPRKFGRMWLVDDPAQVVGDLGPEPLDISAREFVHLFDHRARQLKPLLLDQKFLAGIGNIYADEALWFARLHPLRRAATLTRAERLRLYRAIQKVLRAAIAQGGTSIDVMYTRVNGQSGRFQDELRAFDREERPCRRCGTPIRKIVVGQRGTHFCPNCQKI